MLKIEELNSIKSMGSLCALELTYINGVMLEHEDFGEKYDTRPECAEEYGCGNMQFIPYEKVSEEVLKKYNITEDEAKQIQEKLDCLSFGGCGYCI